VLLKRASKTNTRLHLACTSVLLLLTGCRHVPRKVVLSTERTIKVDGLYQNCSLEIRSDQADLVDFPNIEGTSVRIRCEHWNHAISQQHDDLLVYKIISVEWLPLAAKLQVRFQASIDFAGTGKDSWLYVDFNNRTLKLVL